LVLNNWRGAVTENAKPPQRLTDEFNGVPSATF
jgi:hypothetical protein